MKEIAYECVLLTGIKTKKKKRLSSIMFQKKRMPALAELVEIFEFLLFLFVGSLDDTFCMSA